MSLSSPEPLPLQILSQLIEQEQRTVHQMEVVMEMFHQPLSERSRGIVSFGQHWQLFANFNTLYSSQKTVLEQLSQAVLRLRHDRDAALKAQQQSSIILQHRASGSIPGVARSASQPRLLLCRLSTQPAAGAPPTQVLPSVAVPLSLSSSSSAALHVLQDIPRDAVAQSLEGRATDGTNGEVRHQSANEDDAESAPPKREVSAECDASCAEFTDYAVPLGPDERSEHSHNVDSSCVMSLLTMDQNVNGRSPPSPVSEVYGSPKTSHYHGRIPSDATTFGGVVDELTAAGRTFADQPVPLDVTSFVDDDAADFEMDFHDVVSAFTAPAMMHFLAEHMMFTLHCSRTIFPTLSKLIAAIVAAGKVSDAAVSAFIRPVVTSASGGDTSATAPLVHKGPSFTSPCQDGAAPATSAAVRSSSLSLGSAPAGLFASMRQVNAQLTAETLQVLNKFQRFAQFTTQVLSQSAEQLGGLRRASLPEVDPLTGSPDLSDAAQRGASKDRQSAPNTKSIRDTAPIEELLLLLGEPLPSVQRYVHSARCLVACGSLPESLAEDLMAKFITTAYHRCGEEGSLVLDQVSQHDTAAIIANLDDFTAVPNDNRVLLHSGRLVKRFRRGRHERLMYVFSDLLCYVEPLSNGRERVRGIIPLDETSCVPLSSADTALSSALAQGDIQIVDLEDDAAADLMHAFSIVASNGKPYLFFAPSAVQKRVWLEVLRYAHAAAKRSKETASQLQATGDVPSLVRTHVERPARCSRLERQRRDDRRADHAALLRIRKASRVPSTATVSAPRSPVSQLPLASSALHSSHLPSTPLAGTGQLAGTGFRGSIRRQASLRGSYTAAQWTAELSSHTRVRSTDIFTEMKKMETTADPNESNATAGDPNSPVGSGGITYVAPNLRETGTNPRHADPNMATPQPSSSN